MNVLRAVLQINEADYPDEESISKFMQDNKTDCALKIFDTNAVIKFPQYILDAISWEHEQE